MKVKQKPTKPKKPVMFWRALFYAYIGKLTAGGLMKLVHDILQFSGPMILKSEYMKFSICIQRLLSFSRRILNFLSVSTAPTWLGIFYAVLLGATTFCQTIFLQSYFHRQFILGLRFRSAITGLVYRKVSWNGNWSPGIFFVYSLEFTIIEFS